jgi:hypothetical protein
MLFAKDIYLISKGTDDWDWGIYNACKECHMSIVELLISKGATLSEDQQKKYDEFRCCKKTISLLDYNKDLLEEIKEYY